MNKLKIEQLPDGIVVDRPWLKGKGISASLVDYYMRQEYLVPVACGAYRRPGPPLKWQHLVYSLQELGFNLHVGGRSAIELQGIPHPLSLNTKPQIHLFSEKKLPKWIFKTNVNVEFIEHSRGLFKDKSDNTGLTAMLWGSWDWKINIASPERAMLEMISGVPGKESFKTVNATMKDPLTLKPDLLSSLLEGCDNIKTKRLFLWSAENFKHQWFDHLNLTHVDLGKGKRVVQKSGKFDTKYLITVPKEND